MEALIASGSEDNPEPRRFEVAPQRPMELSVEQVVAQKRKVQEVMKAVMVDGEHYGVIPGTNGKKTLLKPGAETLCFMFRLSQQFEVVDKVETDSRIAFTVRCRLTHIPTGDLISEGLGSCNSREAKYARAAPRKCPVCGKEAIIKGKEEFGGGWLCYKKKQGCGAKWGDGDPAIELQPTEPADPSDLHNTILKMACKRSLTAAVLHGTAASDFFTQDLEDLQTASGPVSSGSETETVKAAKVTQPTKKAAAQTGDEPVLAPKETVDKIAAVFADKFGVALSDLERWMRTESAAWTTQDVLSLKGLYADLRDKKTTVDAEFGADIEPEKPKSSADKLADKIANATDPHISYDTVPF